MNTIDVVILWPDGDLSRTNAFFIKRKDIHRIENDNEEPLVLIEVQLGDKISEEDIVRLEDTYGRN